MSEENSTGGESQSGSATTPAAAPVVVNMTSEQFKQRLDETRDKTDRAAREAVLKELGFDSLSAGKKALDALKSLQQSQMSEQEKREARIKELEPKAVEAEQYAKRYAAAIDREFGRLPENVRNAIDEQAKGDPATREQLMDLFAKIVPNLAAQPSGDANQASPTGAPKPADAGATPPAPRGAAPKSKYEEFVDMQKTKPQAAGLFYQTNRIEIERSRPVGA